MKRNFLAIILSLVTLISVNAQKNESGKIKPYDPDAQQIFAGRDIAIAPTQYGKIQGYISRGIYTFLGVPYGASTEGKNRFMPPQPPQSWDKVLKTLFWGPSAPQDEQTFPSNLEKTFIGHGNYWDMGEDCLHLNVWTPSLDQTKRPVLVWLHGGGFASGNGFEMDSYHGENFSHREDAVFVSINHRLNSFGFSDFASVGGEKYKHSGNVGMLDIIAALQWVRNNIANFGGDPANVTIIGQSGGGAKVCAVAAMPAAKGLIHKAVALSGSSTSMKEKKSAENFGAFILMEAGLEPNEIEKLQQMSWKEYYELSMRAVKKYNAQAKIFSGIPNAGFSPVADDVDIPSGTFYSAGRTDVPDVPMILCSTATEFTATRGDESLIDMTREEAIKMLQQSYKNAEEIYNAYTEVFPKENPSGIVSCVLGSGFRAGTIKAADAKLNQTSPVYMAWFQWNLPLFNERFRSQHCIDIAFWFNNTDFMPSFTGGGKGPRVLSEKMSDAIGAFMRTGNPNTGTKNGLPNWVTYNTKDCPTMILNNECKMVNNPDTKARALMPDNAIRIR